MPRTILLLALFEGSRSPGSTFWREHAGCTMIDLQIVRQRMIAYLGEACGDDLYSTEREIGQHMIAICEGVIAGDLRPDAVMAVQMFAWARARGLVEDD